MRKIGEGHKSEVFVLEDGRILKLFFPHFAYLAAEERNISAILARAGVDAPRVDEEREVDGRPALVFGNLPEGQTLSAAIRKQTWRILSAAGNLARQHAMSHERSSSELPSQRERMELEIREAAGVPEAAREAALSTLHSLPDAAAVCHNDIHMLNVIEHGHGVTIIDWALATRGHPGADVATATLQLRFGERPRGFLPALALEAGRAVFWRAYLRNYLRVGRCRWDEIRRWELPVAVALAGRREGRMRQQLLDRIAAITADREVLVGNEK
jgi:aminoglycoside phosphotransferase (APT) family kinase protein